MNFFKFMQWDITSHCNLHCTHCRSTEFYTNAGIRDLPIEINRRIADDLFVHGVRRIHFLGGEPLIRKDFIKLAEHLHDRGIVWSVNTNATLMTAEVAQRLLAAEAAVVTVSLDGPDAESNDAIRGQGVFGRVCENTARLTGMRRRFGKSTRVVIACTVVQRNVDRLERMIDLAVELGVDSLILSSLRPVGRARVSSKQLAVGLGAERAMTLEVVATLGRRAALNVQLGFLTPIMIQDLNEERGTSFPIYDSSCNALIYKGYIQPDGALFPCQALTDAAMAPAVIGRMARMSLADHGFGEIWESPEMRRIRDLLQSPAVDRRMLPCRFCKYFRTVCYPCPLGALGGSWSVHRGCLEAMSRMASRRGDSAFWEDLVADFPTQGARGVWKSRPIDRASTVANPGDCDAQPALKPLACGRNCRSCDVAVTHDAREPTPEGMRTESSNRSSTDSSLLRSSTAG